jgi:1,4-alpha-glucan branching enzyme
VLIFQRRARDEDDVVIVACNFTPVPRHNYRVGVPQPGKWLEVFNSDGEAYGGSGLGNYGIVEAAPVPYQGHRWSIMLTLPPLAAVYFKPGGE